MTGKSRVDYLVNSESQRQVFGGCIYKLTAVFSSLLGIVVLFSSFFVLSHERLQIQYYLEPEPRFYYEIFPTIYLGCSAATTASSIVQIIGALMLIFEDITLNVWKWLNFTVLMICSANLMLLTKESSKYGDVPAFSVFYVVIILNSIYCMVLLSCDLCCMRVRRNNNEQRPY